VVGGENVGGTAGDRCDVVDRTDLGQALAVALLALGQAGLELGRGRRSRPLGGRPQRVGPHDDAFPVDREHQHVVAGAWLGRRGGVEVVDVGRAAGRELLHLTLGHRHTGGPADRLGRVLIGAAGRLDCGQAAQTVGMAFLGEVQRGVRGVQVRHPPMAIGKTLDHHGAEHGGELTGVPGLDAAVGDTVDAHHLDSRLSLGAQVEVVL